MRQSFAISSSAFGRGKKNQCVISVVQTEFATTTQHPPFTKPDGSVSAQHELSRSRCSDPTGTQMLSRKRKQFGCEDAGERRRTGIHNFRWTGDRVKDGSWDAAGSISGLMAGVLMGPIRQLSVRITTPTGPAPTNESDHHHHQDPGFIPWGINVKTLKLVKKVRQTSWIQTLYPDQNQKLITSVLGWDSIRV